MSFPLNFFLPGCMQNRQLDRLRLIRGETVRWRREKRQRRRLVGFWILCLIVFVFAVRYASDGGWAVSVVTLTAL